MVAESDPTTELKSDAVATESNSSPHAPTPTPRGEAYWKPWIEQWKQSGLKQTDFCLQHSLSLEMFRRWFWKLRKQEEAKSERERPAFLPVEVVSPPPTNAAMAFDLVLPRGRIIRVPAGFDPKALAELIAAVESVP
jgi:hypothetical protein